MQIDLEKVITKIKQSVKKAKNEEELRHWVSKILEDEVISKLEEELKKSFTTRYEYTLISGGRADALYGHVIIEYKAPGKLCKDSDIAKAKEQIVRYIKNKAGVEEKFKSFLGVIISDRIAFVRYDDRKKDWILRGPYEINRESVIKLVEAIRGLRKKKLAVEEILDDFGPKSDVAKFAIKVFYNKIVNAKSDKTKILFEDWKRLFSQVCAYSPEKLKGLEKEYGLKDVDNTALLFAIHTYYALFMKILSAEIAYLFGTGKWLKSYVLEIEDTYMKGLKALKKALEDLESGGIFKRILGITNFVEGDYFSWYIEEFDKDIAEVVSLIARRLADYEPATPILEPEYAKDLLKRLYQNLVPRKVRHDLGEFYTPDWLAELVLDEVGWCVENFERIAKEKDDSTIPLQLRLLDPACGSGTFLVLAIKRIKEYAEEHYLREFLSQYIVKNIVGYDLNPLAVLAARTNYLLSIADLLSYTKLVEIPIYLADSLLLETKVTLTGTSYIIRTSAGVFEIPKKIVDEGLLEDLLFNIEDKLKYYTPDEFVDYIRDKMRIDDENLLDDIKKLYSVFYELEQAGKNKVWVSIIRNAFAPLLKGKFDFVVGNPPWINWESLPEDYRERSKSLWDQYGLLKGKGRGMGKVKREIACLFVARCLDRYTKEGGKLAFLIPFTVFKTQAGAGFREFLVKGKPSNRVACRVLRVHDLVTLYPFEGAVNRTAMIVVERKGKTTFPVPCVVWFNPKSKGIDTELSLDEVKAITKRFEMVLLPVEENKPDSPWMQITEKAYEGIKKVLGISEYRAYAGVNTALNQVYWIEILGETPQGLLIRNPIISGQKKKVEVVEAVVEKDLVYPLVRGRDVKKWFVEGDYGWIIVPHDPNTGKPIAEKIMKIKYPKAFEYFLRFKDELERRSIHKLWGKGNPFYSVYDIGAYTFYPYKVAWKEISGKISGKAEFHTCVLEPIDHPILGNRTVIPDHKLMLIPLNDRNEAYYVSAILNSSIASLTVSSYTIETSIDPRVVEHIRIPKFDRNNPIHQKLSELSKKAHEIAKEIHKNKRAELKPKLQKIEEEIDKLVAQLYGITDEELREIKRCLKILKEGEIEK
ncbi:Eco57I restriction-modification methylase domain-containing protein [Archaeoglobus sp.]